MSALPARYWSKVDKKPGDDCWLWTAATRDGYGTFWLNGQMRSAHRLSFVAARGEVTEALDLDHLCHNRACVNPAHLEPVTRMTNVRRGLVPNVTHCGNGHEWTADNVYRRSNGSLRCKPCHRTHEATRKARQAVAA
jgi:hypothetical protein